MFYRGLKPMLNVADNGYQGHPIRNVRTGQIICFQHRVAVRTKIMQWIATSGAGGGTGSKLLIALTLYYQVFCATGYVSITKI